MTKSSLLKLLRKGKTQWNEWKDANSLNRIDFSELNLDGFNFEGYHLDNSYFDKTSLKRCNFNNAWLTWCNFFNCDLSGSTIINPEIDELPFEDKRLMGVNLRWTNFALCNLEGTNMSHAVLEGVRFYECNLNGANLSNALINGISSWRNTFNKETIQNNLYVTAMNEVILTLDNLEIAQFIYLLTDNKNTRIVLDSLSTKIVLILGSFEKEDKYFLDAFKTELRNADLIPIIYDFDKPESRNHTETVSTIAHLSKFIMADLTHQRSVPHELASIIPQLRSVPVIPIVRDGYNPYGMFEDYNSLNQVGSIIRYSSNEVIKDILNRIMIEFESIGLKLKSS